MRVDAARSDALGTKLPRFGFFRGMRAPDYRPAVIEGWLPGTVFGTETGVHRWSEPRDYPNTQTPSASAIADQLLMTYWSQPVTSVVRSTKAAHASLYKRDDPTDSPWREVDRALQPLRAASDALFEDKHSALHGEQKNIAQSRHAGLAAVARLVDVLGMSRPAILRMGGVPESTFYAWQKHPQSVIRMPTVTRLLRLQAQVAILDKALGRERMRAWILAGDHFGRLQGHDAEFTQVLAEAQASVAEATRIRPRRRMRRADYTATPEDTVGETERSPAFLGAIKLSEEREN